MNCERSNFIQNKRFCIHTDCSKIFQSMTLPHTVGMVVSEIISEQT